MLQFNGKTSSNFNDNDKEEIYSYYHGEWDNTPENTNLQDEYEYITYTEDQS